MYQPAEIRKALVPAVVAAILALLGHFGLTEVMSLGEAVTYAAIAGLTFLIPNQPRN